MPTATNLTETSPTQFIRAGKIQKLLCISHTTLWRLIRNRQFPQPMRVGPGSVAWREDDYEAWAADPEGWVESHKANQSASA